MRETGNRLPAGRQTVQKRRKGPIMIRVLGIISLILFTTCYIPQIIVILRTENISGISVWLWIMVVVGYATGLCYVIWLKEPVLVVNYALGFILALTTLFLVAYHRKQKKGDKNE